ncbi:MAG: Ig-like domain-containing protein [Oscillospiraceae bacterium]
MKKLIATALAVVMSLGIAALPMENSELFSGDKAIIASAETSENFEYEISDDIMDQYNSNADHEHSYTSEVTKQPTCTESGIITYTCICGDTYTELIPATDHKYVTTVVKPTYAAQGYTLHKCSVCEDSYKDNYTTKLILPTISKVSFTTSANAVKMSWSKVSGAKGYVVYKYNASTKKWQKVGVTSGTSYTFSKLSSGTTYKFTVKAYASENEKNYYSPKYTTFTTSTNPATVNFKLTAGTNKVTVKWSKVTGATGYKIYYKTSKNGKWVGLKTVNYKTTSYTKTGLTAGKTYYFTVKAYRTTGGKTYNGIFATKGVKIKEIKAKSIKLNKSKITIQRENKYTLKATVNPKNTTDKTTWASSNKNVATVSSNGVVKGIKPGNATITVKVNGKKAICKVTVTKRKTQSIKLNKSKATIVSGNTLKLTRTVNPTNSEEGVVWSSSNSSVASIKIQGHTCIVTGKNKGTAIITAKSGSKKATCKVTVVGNETKIGQTLYSDRNCQIIYKGYEFDNSSFGYFAIKVQIINKTNKTICVQTRNDSVNNLMTDFIFSPEIAPYKTSNDKIKLMDYQMKNDGIDRNNIRWLDFNFNYFDWDNWLDDVDTPNIHISF